MKKIILLATGLIFSQIVCADIFDTAKVINVQPSYKNTATPRDSCWDEQVPVNNQQHSSMNTGSVIGALTGGLLGNQVGQGNGNRVAIAAGAATGALVGNSINQNQNNQQQTQTVRRCKTAYEDVQIPDGYLVTYSYNGKQDTTRLSYSPGSTIQVRVIPK